MGATANIQDSRVRSSVDMGGSICVLKISHEEIWGFAYTKKPKLEANILQSSFETKGPPIFGSPHIDMGVSKNSGPHSGSPYKAV